MHTRIGGTPREVLERQAAETGFGERIVFEGYRPNLQRVLSALDVFLNPALDDTISLAPLQVTATGFPVVAYADSGALDMVVHDRTGLLVPPCDRAALVACLDRLLGDLGAARRIGSPHVSRGTDWPSRLNEPRMPLIGAERAARHRRPPARRASSMKMVGLATRYRWLARRQLRECPRRVAQWSVQDRVGPSRWSLRGVHLPTR